jgi:predicted nucleic acid-binding Zn ribbon protein
VGPEMLSELLHRLEEQKEFRASREYAALRAWPKAVGRELSQRVQPQWIRGGVLHVQARDHAWANQVVVMKERILSRLREELKEDVVQDIWVHVGGDVRPAVEAPVRRRRRPTFPDPGPPPDFSQVDDPELRQQLVSLWERARKAAR